MTTPATSDLDDPLDDFAHRAVALLDATKTVHVAGTGPAVIVLAEMPGVSPDVARLARGVPDPRVTL